MYVYDAFLHYCGNVTQTYIRAQRRADPLHSRGASDECLTTTDWLGSTTHKRAACSGFPVPSRSMIVVFVFVKAASPASVATLGQSIADVRGVYECYSVTGDHDFVAVLRLSTHEEIARVVTSGIASLNGVASTSTMIAFRSYSSADLGEI